MDANQIYKQARSLIRDDEETGFPRALELLNAHAEAHPHDPRSWYELAGIHDFTGRETEAEGFYERAYQLGVDRLPEAEQPGFYVCYGSTLRNVGKLDKSIQILTEGCERFPKFSALEAFLALSRYTSGQFRLAFRELLTIITDLQLDSTYKDFNGALQYYHKHLDNYPFPPQSHSESGS